MQCPKCQHKNRKVAIFCSECGTKLQYLCPQCGIEVEPSAKFCDNCGASLTKQTLSASLAKPSRKDETQVEPPLSAPEVPVAERRQLTVIFCDLVGSTSLSEQLDPEELRNVVRDYQSVCSKVIALYEGHIAQYLGDGILVYFGYPHAHEDDAGRAVRAGLGICEAIEQFKTSFEGVNLAVRVGIHTGLVVVGEMGGGEKHELLALGDTPIIASRLQEIASPNGVVISAGTYRLVEGFFNCRDMGSHCLKGISQPMKVYQVLHVSAARSRLDVSALKGLTPLVGREQEVGLLLKRWEQVLEGIGQVVLICGEAGIGKSRLVQVIKEHVGQNPQAWLTEFRCLPHYRNSAFYPLIDFIERVILHFDRSDSPDEKLSRLEGFVVQYGLSLEDSVPLFTSLLSLAPPKRYSPLKLSPERQKQKTIEAIATALIRRSTQQPVLFVLEDLHWIDPSTLEWVSLLVDREPTARILTLLTYRPEFSSPWVMHPHLTLLTLNRLSRLQVGDMIEKMTEGKPLPREVLKQIETKTDGVPLFIEELTKMVLDSEFLSERKDHYELTGPLPSLAIPATLQDSLMARLDRIAAVREVAQMAATLGREFSYELVELTSMLAKDALQRDLSRLVEAGLIHQRGLPPKAKYIFKHALIQEAAYQSLLKSRRQQYHQRITRVLEEKFPETTETQPELLAHHYTEAGLSKQAIPYWLKAGKRATERSANLEAISHLTRGIELLKSLPEAPERTEQELTLQIALCIPLRTTRGYTAPEVEEAYTRAEELCLQMGETPQLFSVLWGLWSFHLVRGKHQKALEVAEQLLHTAQHRGDSALLLEAHRLKGAALYWLGEFANARTHLEQTLALYDPQKHKSHAFSYGQDPAVACLSYVAWDLWFLGYPDQSLQRSNEAITLAREISHPYSLVYSLLTAGWHHGFRREEQAARDRAEEAIALCTELGFELFFAWANIPRGWALAMDGRQEEGITQICRSLATIQTLGSMMVRPYFLALLAEAYEKNGQAGEGLIALAEALAVAEKNGESQYEAELYRLKGELLQEQGADEAEVEGCFHEALNTARRQDAKSLELRAAMSLSRMWSEQGKKEEAQKLLQEIYDWFTEGFDTVDLNEAKALLEEIS